MLLGTERVSRIDLKWPLLHGTAFFKAAISFCML